MTGNLPNLLKRITSHKSALGKVLHTEIAKRHHGNPAVRLRVDQIYGLPVLLSGLWSLVMIKTEKDILNQHHKTNLQNLMRLPSGTPPCVVYFMAGSLPGIALLHLRLFSLFGMISRMPESLLHHHALIALVKAKTSMRSWFSQIRELCLEYLMPHPFTLLQEPPSKTAQIPWLQRLSSPSGKRNYGLRHPVSCLWFILIQPSCP